MAAGRRLAGPIGHALVSLLLCTTAWKASLVFFGLSFAAVWSVARLRPGWRAPLRGVAALGLTLLLLVFRANAQIVPMLRPLAPEAPLALVFAHEFSFLGLSYAYLRAVYALFHEGRWSALSYLRYFYFFPTFVSGPVMTPDQFAAGPAARPRPSDGLARMLRGVLSIAAASLLLPFVPLGSRYAADAALAWPVPLLWAGVLMSGVWLYLDFAGHTDVFIGIAALTGVRAPENFDRPFHATDITDFWRRWHISLAGWLRAIVYTPLARIGVSRGAAWRVTAAALAPVLTMAACGAWHGVASGFLLWGLLHGAGLAIHDGWRRLRPRWLSAEQCRHPAYRAASWLATQGFVGCSWVLFLPLDTTALSTRLSLLGALFGGRP